MATPGVARFAHWPTEIEWLRDAKVTARLPSGKGRVPRRRLGDVVKRTPAARRVRKANGAPETGAGRVADAFSMTSMACGDSRHGGTTWTSDRDQTIPTCVSDLACSRCDADASSCGRPASWSRSRHAGRARHSSPPTTQARPVPRAMRGIRQSGRMPPDRARPLLGAVRPRDPPGRPAAQVRHRLVSPCLREAL
jgi:hypothetical protein